MRWTSFKVSVLIRLSCAHKHYSLIKGAYHEQLVKTSLVISPHLHLDPIRVKHDCKRWITRLTGRWRTQLAALIGVNCRIHRIIDIRTLTALSSSLGSVPVWVSLESLTIVNAFRLALVSKSSCSLLRILSDIYLSKKYFSINNFLSTSDQVRAPAWFKHIIQRRKRKQTRFP